MDGLQDGIATGGTLAAFLGLIKLAQMLASRKNGKQNCNGDTLRDIHTELTVHTEIARQQTKSIDKLTDKFDRFECPLKGK